MAEDIHVYKTKVTVSVGFSVEGHNLAGDHHWEKTGVSIETENGPGYPDPERMATLLHYQMMDAVDACDRQLDEIATRQRELMDAH